VRYAEACKHFEEARKYFKRSPEGPDYLSSGHSALEIANNYQYMSKPPEEVEKYVLEAQADLKEHGTVYAVSLGVLALGYFYWYRGNYDAGLEQLEAARTAFEGISRPVDVARCLFEASRCHASKGDYLKALDTVKSALRGYEKIGLARQVCESMILMVRYLKMLDRGDEALEVLRRCLGQSQTLGSPLVIARTMEEFGAIYARKTDYAAARAAYESAQEQFESLPETVLGQEGAARCRHNLLQLARIEKCPDDSGIQLLHATRY